MNYATYDNWFDFMRHKKEPAIRQGIFDSWRRCLENSLDPFRQPHFETNEAIANIQKEDRIFKLLHNLIESNLKSAKAAKIAWLLCGPQGEIIEIDSENQYNLNFLENLGFKTAICLDECFAGTNAIGLSIQSNRPEFCNGPEHFFEKFHSLSGAAAPFYDADYNHKGYIALLGLFPEIDGILLRAMILMLIQTLDREMRLNRSKNLHNNLRKQFARFFVEDMTPMIIVSKSGYIRQVNPAAMKLLEMEFNNYDEKALDKVASFKPTIKEIAKSAIACQKSKMVIRLSGKLLEVTYEKNPIYSEKDEYLGVVLVLNEKSQRVSNRKEDIPETRYTFDDIIGRTPSITTAIDLAKRVAKTSSNVLLTGPSGTGKEMFAHSIHSASDRKSMPFVALNCAAIPREIAESELFGYADGAFTGASKGGSIGKLEAANRGTIFLDEIGDMPLDLQAKLLRVLEERIITRIGENREFPINVRVIAATNKDIHTLVEANKFREDLYYRLSVTSIHLPSLSDSRDDIPELVQSFIEYFNEVMGKKVKGVEDKITESFNSYAWPGNIRELRNAIEFAVMLNSGEDWITWKDLPGQLRMALLYREPAESNPHDPLRDARKEVENSEKVLYQKAIRMANGNMSKASQILNIGRSTLYRKIKKYELKV